MSEQDKTAEGQQPAEQNGQEKKEETISQALQPEASQVEPQKEETVPLSALLELKKANKELTRELRDMKKSIEEGASKRDVSSNIDALAEKFPEVDPDFLKEFAAAVRSETKREIDEDITAKLKPSQEKERAEQIDKRFNTHFDKTIETMPEYKGIVNKDVIKTLSLSPANANKTFTQLIEESYGHLIQGKRSMDPASPRVSKNDPGELDVERAQKDPEYFKEVLSTPALKKKYTESMVQRLASHL